MKHRLVILVLCCMVVAVSVGAAPPKEFKAEVQAGGSALALNVPIRGAVSAYLVVAGPNGFRVEKTFVGGEPVAVNLNQVKDAQGQPVAFADGDYKWELRVNTPSPEAAAAGPAVQFPETGSRFESKVETWVSSGRFKVQDGGIVPPIPEEKARGPVVTTTTAQQSGPALGQGNSVTPQTVVGDNLYVALGVCSGCANLDPDLSGGEVLVKDPIPNLTLRDTTNDQLWRMQTIAGTSVFSLFGSRLNLTASASPMKVEADTPENTLYLDSSGVIGIGTATPTTTSVHLKPLASSFVGIDFDNGTKDYRVYENSSGYFGVEVQSPYGIPFLITPTTPVSYALVIDGAQVGVNTLAPKTALDVNGYARALSSNPTAPTTGKGIEFFYSSTYDWGVFQAFDRSAFAYKNFVLAGSNMIFYSGTSEAMRLDTSGRLGLGVPGPTQPLQLKNGAYCSVGGVWTNASSRAYKQDIRELTGAEAEEAFSKLTPVTFAYKAVPEEHHVGFISEDVPDLVATADRKGLSTMDVVAVLTKVVQEQQKTIAELKAEVAQLKKQR
jgi:hypothetical protein